MLSKKQPKTWVFAYIASPILLILCSIFLLLGPTYVSLAQHQWSTDEQGHGPIILAVTIWLAWQRRAELIDLPDRPAWKSGIVLLLIALVMYVVGRSQGVDTIEVFAHIPFLAAALLLTRGLAGLKWGLFYLLFLLFMVPLPGLIVQTLTTPLKIAVSHVAEWLLHGIGYPVARTGVMLFVGQYQMLVADACAGLNSMFTLEALGLLYMNLMRYTSAARNTLLALLIVPIAFVANVIRVIILVLVTYYYGDAIGQGFVHGFAGIVLFAVSLILILSVDGILGRLKFGRTMPLQSVAI